VVGHLDGGFEAWEKRAKETDTVNRIPQLCKQKSEIGESLSD
jgi:hypothetical protein